MRRIAAPLLLLVLVFYLLTSPPQKPEIIIDEPEMEQQITGAGDGDNPRFTIQYPAGTDIFNITHTGNTESVGNHTIAGLHIDRINSTHHKMWS